MRSWQWGLVVFTSACVAIGSAAAKPTSGGRHKTSPQAPQELLIPLGRVQLFGEQQQQAMADIKAEIEDDSRDPHALYGKLYVAIWIHNVNVQRACSQGVVPRKICRSARFRPRWLKEPGAVVYSYRSMLRFVEEAQNAMTPFWSELCGDAAKAKGQKVAEYCPME